MPPIRKEEKNRTSLQLSMIWCTKRKSSATVLLSTKLTNTQFSTHILNSKNKRSETSYGLQRWSLVIYPRTPLDGRRSSSHSTTLLFKAEATYFYLRHIHSCLFLLSLHVCVVWIILAIKLSLFLLIFLSFTIKITFNDIILHKLDTHTHTHAHLFRTNWSN